MNSPIFKSEKKAAKGEKKSKLTPKTPGGWAVLQFLGSMKEIHEREKRRLPK